MNRTYSPEDSWSNDCAFTAKQAIWAGISFERALEIFRECWVLELRDETRRVEQCNLKTANGGRLNV